MKKIKDKMIPTWIKERKKEKKQKDYAMRTFMVIAFLIILLGSYDNCTNLILK
tara:strand:+ start:341 stop:499 length:159 start_codon:yes stop_codon:yes gene_type:complete